MLTHTHTHTHTHTIIYTYNIHPCYSFPTWNRDGYETVIGNGGGFGDGNDDDGGVG